MERASPVAAIRGRVAVRRLDGLSAPAVPARVRLRVRPWVVQLRPYLMFVSGLAGAAGLALGPGTRLGVLVAAGLAFFLSYGFGQVLTDCFQTDTDALSAPERPLSAGRLDRRLALAGSLAGLAACGGTFVLLEPRTLPLVAAAIAGLSLYTPLKRRWWAGPPWNALVVALLVPIGWACAGGMRAPLTSPLPLAAAALAAFFGYADFVLVGYFKDVEADRATGYRTLPVAFGRRRATAVAHLLSLLGLAAGLVAILSARPSAPVGAAVAATLWTAALVAAIAGHVRLARVRTDERAHEAIVPVVVSFVFLMAAIAVAGRPGWWPLLLLYAGAFPLSAARRPVRAQV